MNPVLVLSQATSRGMVIHGQIPGVIFCIIYNRLLERGTGGAACESMKERADSEHGWD